MVPVNIAFPLVIGIIFLDGFGMRNTKFFWHSLVDGDSAQGVSKKFEGDKTGSFQRDLCGRGPERTKGFGFCAQILLNHFGKVFPRE